MRLPNRPNSTAPLSFLSPEPDAKAVYRRSSQLSLPGYHSSSGQKNCDSRVERAENYGGTPLWRLAQEKGMKVAPYYWVGSEVSYDNHQPDYNYPYTDTTTNQSRVEKVLEWLSLPEKERP